MSIRAAAVVAAVVLAGCVPASMQGPTTATPDPTKKAYSMPCDDAHRFAAASLKANGYAIQTVERSPSGGVVAGVRPNGEEMEFRISCGAAGVQVATSGSTGKWAEQAMWFSFNQVAEFGDRIWPPPKGPVVKVQALRGPEAKLYFPQALEPQGLAAMRVRIVNGGARTLRLEPRRTTARGESGPGVPALSADGVRSRLGGTDPGIDGKILQPRKLAQGEEVTGFVFFPAGEYGSVVFQLIDDPTGEADEFEVFLGK